MTDMNNIKNIIDFNEMFDSETNLTISDHNKAFSLYFGTIEVDGNSIQSIEGNFNDDGSIYEWWANSGMKRVYGINIDKVMGTLMFKFTPRIWAEEFLENKEKLFGEFFGE